MPENDPLAMEQSPLREAADLGEGKFHHQVAIPRIAWIVLLLAGIGGIVAATVGVVNAAMDKREAEQQDTVTRENLECIVALLLVAPEERTKLTDTQIRAVCPAAGVDAARNFQDGLRNVPVPPVVRITIPATTTTTETEQNRSTTTNRRSPTTTTAPPNRAPAPAPPTTTAPPPPPAPCPTVPVLGICTPSP